MRPAVKLSADRLMAWWFQVGAAITIFAIVFTLAIEQRLLPRQQDVLDADLTGAPAGTPPPPSFLSKIPRDVYSILGIVIVIGILLFAIIEFFMHRPARDPEPKPDSGYHIVPGSLRLSLPEYLKATFSPLPKDFSIN